MAQPFYLKPILGVAAVENFVGTCVLSYLWIRFIYFVYFHVFCRDSSSILRYKHHHPKAGKPWAIITGSTDSIGEAYAHQLAQLGFNIILHSGDKDKLQKACDSLQHKCPGVEVRMLVQDGANLRTRELKKLHITVLINNVGMGTKDSGPIMQPFVETTTKNLDKLINSSVRFPIQFTHAVLPHLLSHGGPALILTMGSIADFGVPYLATYSGMKSSNLAFSRALRREMKVEGWQNLEVLGVMLAGVTRPSWDKSSGGWLRPTSEQFVRATLGFVGCGKDVVAPWWNQDLMWMCLKNCPDWLLDMVMTRMATKMMTSPQYAEKGKEKAKPAWEGGPF